MTSKINLQALWLIAVFGFFSGCQKEVSIDTGVTGAVFDLKIQFKPVVDGLPSSLIPSTKIIPVNRIL